MTNDSFPSRQAQHFAALAAQTCDGLVRSAYLELAEYWRDVAAMKKAPPGAGSAPAPETPAAAA